MGILLAGCSYDVARLGYPNETYPSVDVEEVAVYMDKEANGDCKQIGVTVSSLNGTLQDIIDNLRKDAAKTGANYVNINNVNYSAGFWDSSDKFVLATFYRCSK